MAEETANVLVEIEPDLSRFEETLRRQLEDATRKIEKSGASKIEVALQVDKSSAALEKSMKQSLTLSKEMTANFTNLSESIEVARQSLTKSVQLSQQINTNFNALQRTFQNLETSAGRIATNFNRVTIGGSATEQAIGGSVGRVQRLVFLAANLSTIFQNMAVIIDSFAKIQKFVSLVKGLNREFVFMGEQTAKIGTFVKGFVGSLRGAPKTAEEERRIVGKIQETLARVLATRQRINKETGKPEGQKSISEAFRDAQKQGSELQRVSSELQRMKRITIEAGKAGAGLGENFKKLGRNIREAVPPAEVIQDRLNKGIANATSFGARLAAIRPPIGLKEAVVQVESLRSKLSGPGTAALSEFSRTNQSVWTRVTTVFGQAMQNMRFHLSKFGTTLRESFLIAPVANFFSALNNIVTSASGGINSFRERIAGLKEAFKTFAQEGQSKLLPILAAIASKLGAKGLLIGGVAALATAIAGVGKGFIALAGKASRLAESVNAVTVTLGPQAAESFRALIGDTSALGLSTLELNESITPIVPLLKNAGLEGGELASKLNDLVRRGVDLGSIFNRAAGDVLPALGAAIRGEIEPAERLGIQFNAAAVEARALADGAQKVDGQLSEEAKTMARLNLVLEKSQFAANDYKNTSEGLANATKSFQAVITELGFAFSNVFLKGAEKIRGALNELVSTIGPGIVKVFKSITPLVDEFGEKIADIFIKGALLDGAKAFNDSLLTMIPVLDVAVDLLQAALNIFEVFNIVLGRVLPGNISLLQVFFTHWLAMRQVNLLLPIATTGVKILTAALAQMGATGAAASMSAFGASLSALSGPIGIALTGLLLLQQHIKSIKDEARAAAAELLAGEDLTTPKGQADAQKVLEDRKKEIEDQLNSPGNTLKWNLTPQVDEEFIKLESELEGVNKQMEDLSGRQAAIQDLFDTIQTSTGENRDNILVRLREAGIDLSKIPFDEIAGTANKMILSFFSEKNKISAENLAKAFEQTKSNLEALISTSGAVQSANQGLTAAQNGLRDATQAVSDIEKQRAEIMRDTISETQELIDAEEALIRVGWRLRDLDQEEADLLEQLQELKAPATADELAAADRSVERAKIALNRAIREEAEALKEVNDQQITNVDLTGLTVDEIKTRLSNLRETLKAQKQVEDARKKDDSAKTQVEIDEERAEKSMSVLDAAQALKDVEAEREELKNREIENADQIRETEERLVELALDRKDLSVEQEAAQKNLNSLKAGETTLSKALKQLEEQKSAAMKSQAASAQAVRDAEVQVQLALAEQDLAQARITNNKFAEEQALIRILELKSSQAGLDEATRAIYQQQLDLLRAQSAEVGGISRAFGLLSSLKPITVTAIADFATDASASGKAAAAIDALAEAFLASKAGEALVRNVGALAQATGTRLPSPNIEGGLITGVPGEFGTLLRAGERGYDELILPFQRDPMRSASLLARYAPEVASLAGSPSPAPSLGGLKMSPARQSYVSPNKPTRLEQKLERLITAIENGELSSTSVSAPINVSSTDPDLAARKAARAIKKLLDEAM